jgi:2-oxoglutarate ferredoxin oxidoreductase subunit gamma
MKKAPRVGDESPQRANGQEHRLIVAGFGGQGILTLGKLLCMAAMREGKKVTYLPAYGPEVRGGTANCQVVISSGIIYSPLVEQADSAIILNQLSYERFARALKPSGLLLVNSSGVDTDAPAGKGASTAGR